MTLKTSKNDDVIEISDRDQVITSIFLIDRFYQEIF